MNISESFANYLVDLSLGTLGTDIFIGAAPLEAQDNIWWILPVGGSPDPKNSTGERMKNYILNVYYRDLDQEQVYEKIQDLEEEINSKHCTQLDGYTTIDMSATSFGADQDLDNEDRTVGLLEVTLTTYS